MRHRLFDWGVIYSEKGKLPSVVVGNLSLGGTGKTPFTIWLTTALKESGHHPAVVSRGYGRATTGFRWVNEHSTSSECGDEPLLMKQWLPEIDVAVCENRLKGIEELANSQESVDAVVLDDAFQHRQLKGEISILLTSFHRPFWKDRLVPAGRLRDIRGAAERAQVLVVTGCPETLSTEVMDKYRSDAKAFGSFPVCFSGLDYGNLSTLDGRPFQLPQGAPVIGFSGIADPETFHNRLKTHFNLKIFHKFPDHHPFTALEVQALLEDLATFADPSGVLITTGKDAMRLRHLEIDKAQNIAVLPVQLKFIQGEELLMSLVSTALGRTHG